MTSGQRSARRVVRKASCETEVRPIRRPLPRPVKRRNQRSVEPLCSSAQTCTLGSRRVRAVWRVVHKESRVELVQSVFRECDRDADGHLNGDELHTFALHTGFDEGTEVWRQEFLAICVDSNVDPGVGISEVVFASLIEDKSDLGCYCTDDVLRRVLSDVRKDRQRGAGGPKPDRWDVGRPSQGLKESMVSTGSDTGACVTGSDSSRGSRASTVDPCERTVATSAHGRGACAKVAGATGNGHTTESSTAADSACDAPGPADSVRSANHVIVALPTVDPCERPAATSARGRGTCANVNGHTTESSTAADSACDAPGPADSVRHANSCNCSSQAWLSRAAEQQRVEAVMSASREGSRNASRPRTRELDPDTAFTDGLLRYWRRTPEDEALVQESLRELEIVRESLPESETYKLSAFGSVVSGFGMRGCDLDVVLCREPPLGEAEDGIETLLNLERALKGSAFTVKDVVKKARVPLLKLDYKGQELDLSVNNPRPLQNTLLLKAYAQLHSNVTDLVLLVKLWAQANRLKGAPARHLSSYALTLMVIYYLQVVCGVPSLQESGFAREAVELECGRCWKSATEMLHDFFAFYAWEFRWGTEVVSVRCGRRQDVDSDQFRELGGRWDERLHIEDPLECSRNLRDVLWRQHEELLRERICAMYQMRLLTSYRQPFSAPYSQPYGQWMMMRPVMWARGTGLPEGHRVRRGPRSWKTRWNAFPPSNACWSSSESLDM